MGFKIKTQYPKTSSIYAYIRQVSDTGADGLVWDDTNSQWASDSALPQPSDAERISMTARTGVEQSLYDGETSADLGTYTGRVTIHIVDTATSVVEQFFDAEVISGQETQEFHKRADAAASLGNEEAKTQTHIVYVESTLTGKPATGSVASTQIAAPSASPSFTACTNTATYTGSPGVYQVELTAAETTTSGDARIIRVTTSDGQGDLYLHFGLRQLETDWIWNGSFDGNEGDLASELFTLGTNLITIDTAVNTTIPGSINGLPTAVENATELLDHAISGHVTAGSVGNLIERLDLIATGGAGELTAARAANLDNADASIAAVATPAEVVTSCTTALTDLHLDHLLAAAYDPTSKPGNGSSLFNVVIESDGGVPRFTANSLEQGPSGGSGGASASAIADAVWDELQSDHTTAGSFGEIATEIAAVLVDTNEMQGDLTNGGRLDLLFDAMATSTQVSALNNLSTADIDARLAAVGLDGYEADHGTLLVAFTNLQSHGDTNWATATGFSTHTAANVRTEMDSNSTQLAAIVADTNELQGDITTGGRTDLLIKACSTHDAAAVRTEMDSNSTQLAAIVADTNELQTDWADGGRLDEIVDAAGGDVSTDLAAVKGYLEPGGITHTQIASISPNPNTLSAEVVADARTWVAPEDADTASNIIRVGQGDSAHYRMDFGPILNPDTSVGTAAAPTLVEGDADLTFGTAAVAQDHMGVHVQITGQQSGKRYKIKMQCTTTDNETISRMGIMKVS